QRTTFVCESVYKYNLMACPKSFSKLLCPLGKKFT
ncbi:hypothetical protein CP8484711_1325B, partial [Chlamydia psittaci 84-8471/1]